MKPYYSHAGITIYHGDCREVLPTLEPVDLVLTDPPYGVSIADWDQEVLPLDWLIQCRNLAKCVIFTPGVKFLMAYPQPTWSLCWARPASVQRNAIGGFNNWEPLLVYGEAEIDNDLILMPHVGKEIDGHPCAKPQELMARVIAKINAQTIIDPFMGSGTTLRAAKDLGRRAIGIEIEEKYCEIAAKRLSQEVFSFAGDTKDIGKGGEK